MATTLGGCSNIAIFDVLKNVDGARKNVRKIGRIITPAMSVSKMRRIVG